MEKPLVYYAVSVFMGSLSAMLLFESPAAAAAISAFFCFVIYSTLDRESFVLIILFFILGMISFNIYFAAELPTTSEIRITDKKYYNFIGEYNGRKVMVKGETSELKLGDKIKAEGVFKRERDFKRGIIGSFCIESYEKSNPDIITNFYHIKREIHKQFSEKLGEENSSVLMALCFGDDSYLTNSQMNDFNRMGVIHAISVSGFHMALVYGILDKILGVKAALASAFVYAVFTGCQAATLRAFIMIFILKMSNILFRNYDSISSISMAALVLLLIKPWYIGDIGFMLSFLSTLGIILYFKKLSLFFVMLPKGLRDTVSVSLSTQLLSLPYIAFTIRQFSPGFILGNFVLMPFYSILVILGNAALLSSPLKPLFSIICCITGIVMNALSGADYLLLKLCPEIIRLNYLQGVSLMLIYLSFVFYKKGFRQVAFYPAFVILFLCICNFSFFPEVYYKKLENSSSTFIEYKDQKIMVCNYDYANAYELYRLEEDIGVTKVITNVRSKTSIELGNNERLMVYPSQSPLGFNDLAIYSRNKICYIGEKSAGDKSGIYVIIFSKLVHFG